ncbi:hypothetical protein [Paenisporosarcina sp. TG-14]|uniref:hypothetical protein n=1 Tax=Paenisporosarcina sp. TG-14 TaxID=1231057 RepID=UPI0002EE9860|nr:hypothetical protein [Paenisporosarcina sp. TG-14]
MSSNNLDCLKDYPYAKLTSQDRLFHFKICFYYYTYPEPEDEHDADWHITYLYLTIPAFKAEINDVMLEGKLIEYFIREFEKFLDLKKE